MIRIALLSLTHDRGKLLSSLAGVAFASTLLLTQVGMYVGFLRTSSSMISQVGGDVWVMPRRTEVIDNSDVLTAGSRVLLASHPCAARVRGHVQTFASLRKASGALDAAMVVGYEPGSPRMLPWNLARGLPQDLHAPDRITVDEGDLAKLQVAGDPLAATLLVNGTTVHIAAVTRGIKAFTLTPYLFMEIDTARRLTRLADGQAHYWVVDARSPACVPDLVRFVNAQRDLEAHTTRDFVKITENFWVGGSGVGAALGFAAILGLVVGAVLAGQTLYNITKEHRRELATLKAIGASAGELVRFVAWQAAFLATFGGGTGVVIALGLQRMLLNAGLVVELSGNVLALGIGAIVGMCVVASIGSIRAVLSVEAAEVFR